MTQSLTADAKITRMAVKFEFADTRFIDAKYLSKRSSRQFVIRINGSTLHRLCPLCMYVCMYYYRRYILEKFNYHVENIRYFERFVQHKLEIAWTHSKRINIARTRSSNHMGANIITLFQLPSNRRISTVGDNIVFACLSFKDTLRSELNSGHR